MKHKTIIRLITLGDSNAGKSCIINYFVEKKFTAKANTVGVDFYSKEYMIDQNNIKVQIYDTSGQEKFRTIASNYYKRADGILLVFDITQKQTFLNMQYWIKEMQSQMNTNTIGLVILGNKNDLPDKVVQEREGKELASTLNTEYFETSALNGHNIFEAMDFLIKQVVKKKDINLEEKEIPATEQTINSSHNSVELTHTVIGEKQKKKCC